MRRYQVRPDAGVTWNGLVGKRLRATRQLIGAFRGTTKRPIRWQKVGAEKWNEAKGPIRAALAIVSDTKGRNKRTDYETNTVVAFRLLDANVDLPSVPAAAAKTLGTKRTLAFHTEMQLVFPDWKTLGLYVPRPIHDDPNFWSEHAWAAAEDTGMRDDANPGGFETDITRLGPFLETTSRYVLANFRRLGLNRHIYDRKSFNATPGTPDFSVTPYTGSDPHETHLHDQFADHDGHKPPWV